MAGTTRDANLSSRTSRSRLRKQREPHWVTLVVGRAALGWQRPGRWLLRTYDGSKYQRTFLGRSDEHDGGLTFDQASAAARAIVDDPTAAASTRRLTVAKAMQRYIEAKQAAGQPVGDLISRSNAWIIPALGPKLVADLTAQRLRDWLATMAAMPAMKRSRPDAPQAYKPAPATEEARRARMASANRVLTALKAALNHAYDEGLISNRDAWGRKLKPFPNVEVARSRFLSIAEAQRLINAADPDFRPLVRAALETGCRYGELTRLEVADFNPDAGTIAIRRSKTGKARHVILTPEATSFFRHHSAGRAGSERMFRHASGREWKKSEQAWPMAIANARAKIEPQAVFHQLRHSWASHAVMNGVPLMVVAKNLGHADTSMVEHFYGHLAPSFVVDAIRDGAPRYGIEPDGKVTALK
jgi:integrase